MQNNLFITACDLLSKGQKLVLAKIIRRAGSTPRDIGSMCIVTEDNKLIGTVGGGLLEFKMQQEAIALLETRKTMIFRYTLSGTDLANSGMICGGDVDLFLEPVFPENASAVRLLETLKEQIVKNAPCTLVTRIIDGIDTTVEDTRLLIKNDGSTIGDDELFDLSQEQLSPDFFCRMLTAQNHENAYFVEKLASNPQILLFGAGHISQFVVQLAKMVEFDITVIDDREKFANKDRLPLADNILVSDFDRVFEKLSITANTYILIITRGHLHDRIVLEQALDTNAAYIGMIGSRKKIAATYQLLMDNGVQKERLDQVCAPVGLKIDAQTPEEIAVSIIAQLIQKRAEQYQILQRIA